MVAALPLLVLSLVLQDNPHESPPLVVAAAVRAVEGDTAEPLRRRWTARLARNRSDSAARLGLAILAGLAYRHTEAESLFTSLAPVTAARGGRYAWYAWLGLGGSYAMRGLPGRAGEAFARAEASGAQDPVVRVRALLGLADALSRTQRDAAADSLMALIAGVMPAGNDLLEAEYRCARAGPPLLPGELEETAEAEAGRMLARRGGDRRLEARCLLGVAKAQYGARWQDSALASSAAAARLAESARDRAGLAAILQWRGYALLTGGDYGGAWHGLHDAATIARESGSLGAGGLAAMYLSSLALRFGDPELALTHAMEAESLLTETGNARTLGSLRAIRGDIARAVGDTALARVIYRDLIARSGRFGGFGAVAPYRGLATMARRRGDWTQAESLLAEAQVKARSQGMQEWDHRLWYDRGTVALGRREDHVAETAFHRFLGGLAPAQQARGYAARVRLAEVAARRGDLDQALAWLTAAADSLDALRLRLDVRALRLQSFQIRDDEADPDLAFASVIAALAVGGRGEPAFALVERRRGRELGDEVIRSLALRRVGDDTLRPARMTPVALPELQQVLGPTTALLSYVTGMGGEPTTVFVVQHDRVSTRILPPVDSLASALGAFASVVEQGDSLPAAAARLGSALLAAPLGELADSIEQLIIVPDGGLYQVPFDALVVGGKLLLERFVTSRLPSATLLVQIRRLPPREGVGLLALGDPIRTRLDDGSMLAALGPVGVLPPLPEARREAREVAGYAPRSLALVGRAASETAFKRLAPGRRVLHFAVHAVVSQQALTRTALVLTSSPEDDGLVSPGELAALRLDPDLVVLSACRSATGVILAGEGVRGLITPFLEGGTRAVVGNIWAIGDRGAHRLMRKLYEGMSLGLAVGPALRRARLEARKEGLAPAVWAGFVLTGDPQVVVPLQPPAVSRGWIAAGIILAACGAWWMRGRLRARVPAA